MSRTPRLHVGSQSTNGWVVPGHHLGTWVVLTTSAQRNSSKFQALDLSNDVQSVRPYSIAAVLHSPYDYFLCYTIPPFPIQARFPPSPQGLMSPNAGSPSAVLQKSEESVALMQGTLSDQCCLRDHLGASYHDRATRGSYRSFSLLLLGPCLMCKRRRQHPANSII